jgi:stage II sporulation protein P
MKLISFLKQKRWIIYIIFIFLFLVLIRDFFGLSFSVSEEPLPPPPDDDAAWMDPLPVPFYPTLENIHLINNRRAAETYLYTVDETAHMPDEYINIEEILKINLHTRTSSGSKEAFEGPIAPDTSQANHGAEPGGYVSANLIAPHSNAEGPRVLIFHTHSQEAFADSRPGEVSDTIVGVGAELARVLAEDYGISSVHDFGRYDIKDNAEYRDGSYERMEPEINKLLDKYPSVEITIDVHRDGVPEDRRLVTDIGGKSTARIMFFNGISYLNEDGIHAPVESLPNPYVKQNLAFSLRLQLTANELYPGFARRIYIRPYRYSLHFKPMSALVEVGAQNNTVAEAMNAVKPLAEILVGVIGV